MIEEGQVFEQDGLEICVLELIRFDGRLFALTSLKDEYISYSFFEITESENDYSFNVVEDDETLEQLVKNSKIMNFDY